MSVRISYLSIFIVLLLVLAAKISGYSQTIILKEEVKENVKDSYGINKMRFFHLYFGYGMVAGPGQMGSNIVYGSSGGFKYGLRYKRKLNGLLALGWDMGYHGTNFFFKQETGKTFPDGLLHKSEKLSLSAYELNVFCRFNVDVNRGNYMGKYLDLGLGYNRNLGFSHVTNDDLPNGAKTVTTRTNLDYVNKDAWFALARIGFNRLVFTGTWRISQVFKNEGFKELPPFVIGMELGFY
jgi:hypothetical protein